MSAFLTNNGHMVTAFAVIATIGTLIGLGDVTSAVGVPVIIAAGGVTIGAIAATPNVATTKSTTP